MKYTKTFVNKSVKNLSGSRSLFTKGELELKTKQKMDHNVKMNNKMGLREEEIREDWKDLNTVLEKKDGGNVYFYSKKNSISICIVDKKIEWEICLSEDGTWKLV